MEFPQLAMPSAYAERNRAFKQATKHIIKRRKLLLALVRNDGWSWDAVGSSLTTNRTTSLDDETMVESVILH